jgi:hypothetical protein
MNGQLQQALSSLISSAVDAKTFLVAELPEVVRQLLLWKMWVSLLETAIGAGLLFCVIYGTYKYIKHWDFICEHDMEQTSVGVGVADLVLGLMGFFCAFNFDWLQIWLAPKVYLIEYAAKLATK